MIRRRSCLLLPSRSLDPVLKRYVYMVRRWEIWLTVRVLLSSLLPPSYRKIDWYENQEEHDAMVDEQKMGCTTVYADT
jgi:hypothetical protein